MKKFLQEFKAFLMRGNVLDMAVAVIIGAAFSAVVTAFTNGIILPVVNYFVGGTDGDGLITVLRGVYVTDATTGVSVLDKTNSIYIDWGTFINKVIDFILVALVLFIIIKAFMAMQNLRKGLTGEDAKKIRKLTKQYKKEGLSYDKAKEKAEAEVIAAKAEPLPPPAPTTEELLTQIRDLLSKESGTNSDENK